jgi:hypothetical protein
VLVSNVVKVLCLHVPHYQLVSAWSLPLVINSGLLLRSDAQAYFIPLILKGMGWSRADALLLVSISPQEEWVLLIYLCRVRPLTVLP